MEEERKTKPLKAKSYSTNWSLFQKKIHKVFVSLFHPKTTNIPFHVMP